MSVRESLARLDRRVLGVGRWPSQRTRQKFWDDLGDRRPVDPELADRMRAWAADMVGERRRRRNQIAIGVAVLLLITLVIAGVTTGAPIWGGVGGLLGSTAVHPWREQRERREARAVQRWAASTQQPVS